MPDPRTERFADETQIDPDSPNRRNSQERTMADQKAEPEGHDLQSNSKLKRETTKPGGDDTARTLEKERSDGGTVGGKPGAADRDGATV